MRSNVKNGVTKSIIKGAFVLIALFSVLSSSSFAAVDSFQGCIGWVGTGRVPNKYLYDQTGVGGTKLAVGNLVQVFYSGPNHAIDALDPSTGLPVTSGDDRLIASFVTGKDYKFGYFTGTLGEVFNTYNSTYETTADGAPVVYVRVWNGPQITSSDHYGVTTTIIPQLGANPINYNDPNAYPVDLATTTSFIVANTPNITSIAPVAGTTGGTVIISGSNFGAIQGTVGFQLMTGGTTYAASAINSWTDTSISVTVPAAAGAGLYQIVVTNSSSKTGARSPYYHTVPYIYSINPITGPTGSTVTVTGSNFASPATVHFDAPPTYLSGASVNVVNSTTLTFQTPASSNGPYNVSITTANGTSNQTTFTVSSTSPQISGVRGAPLYIGTSVMTVDGTNLGSSSAGNSVTVGGVTMTSTAWSSTSITGIVPTTVAAGTDNVVVTVGGNASNAYSVVCYPRIVSITPATGMAGTDVVTIDGFGFGAPQGTSIIRFNGLNGGTAASWSNTRVTMVVPSAATTEIGRAHV
jgi:hypothetical protein